MKKILVLGGSGFLGKHVVAQLAELNDVEVTSLSRKEGTDINDLPALISKITEIQPDVIINCAAHVGSLHYVTTYAGDVLRDNIQMISNMYEAVRQVMPAALVINPLSNCSYPGDANIHFEPDWLKGAVHDSVIAYGNAKRMAYVFAESYRKQYGIRSVNWLVSNAYGPGDYTDPNKVHALNGILIRLIQAKKNGDAEFSIWGSGKPIREWVYIADAARILVQSLDMEEQTYPMNLAQNKGYSITEIAEAAKDALGYDVTFVYDTSKPDGAPIKILDDKGFRAAHPDFRFTPLEDGVRNTIEYYQKVL